MTWSTKELRENGVPEHVIALRAWRKRHGITLRELATACDVDPSELSALECGKRHLSLGYAEKIRDGCRRVGPPNAELGAFDAELERMKEQS